MGGQRWDTVIAAHSEPSAVIDRGRVVSAAQSKRYYAGGQLLATRTGTTLRYVQGDHLDSTSTLTDGGGAVVARERYSAFGERRRGESALVTAQLYTGQRLNVLSNLYHSDGASAGRFYQAVADISWRPARFELAFACCQRLVSPADYADAPL